MLGLARPFRKFQRPQDNASSEADPGIEGSRRSPLLETIFSCGIVIVLAAALWQSQTFPPRAALFPRVVLVFTLALSMFHIGRLLRTALANRGHRARSGQAETNLAANMFAVFVWFIGFLLMIWLFGFVVGAPLSIFLYLALAARESWGRALVLATPAFLFVYVVMDLALNVPFPVSAFLHGW
jgi:hypothetical protein